jgi:hypothetical protein
MKSAVLEKPVATGVLDTLHGHAGVIEEEQRETDAGRRPSGDHGGTPRIAPKPIDGNRDGDAGNGGGDEL